MHRTFNSTVVSIVLVTIGLAVPFSVPAQQPSGSNSTPLPGSTTGTTATPGNHTGAPAAPGNKPATPAAPNKKVKKAATKVTKTPPKPAATTPGKIIPSQGDQLLFINLINSVQEAITNATGTPKSSGSADAVAVTSATPTVPGVVASLKTSATAVTDPIKAPTAAAAVAGTVTTLDSLAAPVKALIAADYTTALTKAQADLTTAAANLKKAQKLTANWVPLDQMTKDAFTGVQTALGALGPLAGLGSDGKTQVAPGTLQLAANAVNTALANETSGGSGSASGALKAAAAFETTYLTNVAKLLDGLKYLDAGADQDPLRQALKSQGANYTLAMQLRYLSGPKITALQALLATAKPAVDPGAVTAAQTGLDTTLSKIISLTPTWLAIMTQDEAVERGAALSALKRRATDAIGANAENAVIAGITPDIDIILITLQTILAQAAMTDFPATAKPAGLTANPYSDKITELTRANETLKLAGQNLLLSVPVNITTWTSAEIPIYYFDDVTELIRVLAGASAVQEVGTDSLTQAANTARVNLDSASQTLLNAQTDVANLKVQIQNASEALRQGQIANAATQAQIAAANANVATLTTIAQGTQAKVNSAQLAESTAAAASTAAASQLTAAQNSYNTAMANSATSPAMLAQLQAAVVAANQASITATMTTADDQANLVSAQGANSIAQANLTAAQNTANALAAGASTAISTLQQNLSDALSKESAAQSAQRTAMTNAFLTAQAGKRCVRYGA